MDPELLTLSLPPLLPSPPLPLKSPESPGFDSKFKIPLLGVRWSTPKRGCGMKLATVAH